MIAYSVGVFNPYARDPDRKSTVSCTCHSAMYTRATLRVTILSLEVLTERFG
jgi:hypothetical protein